MWQAYFGLRLVSGHIVRENHTCCVLQGTRETGVINSKDKEDLGVISQHYLGEARQNLLLFYSVTIKCHLTGNYLIKVILPTIMK